MKSAQYADGPSRSFIEAFNRESLVGNEHSEGEISESSFGSSTSEGKTTDGETNGSKDLVVKEGSLNVRLWRYAFWGTAALFGAMFVFDVNYHQSERTVVIFNEKYSLLTRFSSGNGEARAKSLVQTLHGLAQVIATQTDSSNFASPYVPLFEVSAETATENTDLEVVAYSPFVYRDLSPAWDEFVSDQDLTIITEKSSLSGFNDSTTNWTNSIMSTLGRFGSGDRIENILIAPVLHWSPSHETETMNRIDIFLNGTGGILTLLNDTDGIILGPIDEGLNENGESYPRTTVFAPVVQNLSGKGRVDGMVFGSLRWDHFVASIVPMDVEGIYVVLRNSCGQAFTFTRQDRKLQGILLGDDRSYMKETEADISLSAFRGSASGETGSLCSYQISMYSSSEFRDASQLRLVSKGFVTATGVVFLSMLLIFFVYDRLVQLRNSRVLKAAEQSNALISSFFPGNVRKRLMEQAEEHAATSIAQKDTLQSLVENDLPDGDVEEDDEDENELVMYKSKPIADLFPESTILFADISGFTAWSSVREPSQVFILLETLYRAYDTIARKRGVFKVETVGDCYVAVTGVPDPRKDHAVAMCRFARECLMKTRVLVRKLEVTLGPDTGDLAMRMGIHSGPVTAGVLRGERSRFQLFGDTMNTAARMEHTGIRDRVQVSQETADLLIAAGKTNWVTRRDDVVYAKGKGELQTFWLEYSTRSNSAYDRGSSAGSTDAEEPEFDRDTRSKSNVLDPKTMRLIEWNVDVLVRLLKQITSRRRSCPAQMDSDFSPPDEEAYKARGGVLDEVREIVALPEFKNGLGEEDPESVELPSAAVGELHDYVSRIAKLYRNNPFHNFEHASHVTMSVVKLLSRIVAPHEYMPNAGDRLGSSLHDHTYGITSDPLTQFACVFSALIHDADHAGVSNAQLVKERDESAVKYNLKSVLEQKSILLAWDMLMEPQYHSLRSIIYQSSAELRRFRQLVVNSVMATDIVDKELKTLRNLRWERAFSEGAADTTETQDAINRKATIVIEHLIQASDVAHTMQHWHIYRKWNERFFTECYEAFQAGRAEKDPSIGWYQGEIGFFDFYIIPLARKLKECGVFGVSSDEYLNYAIHNRQEWKARGQEVVDEMINNLKDNKSPK